MNVWPTCFEVHITLYLRIHWYSKNTGQGACFSYARLQPVSPSLGLSGWWDATDKPWPGVHTILSIYCWHWMCPQHSCPTVLAQSVLEAQPLSPSRSGVRAARGIVWRNQQVPRAPGELWAKSAETPMAPKGSLSLEGHYLTLSFCQHEIKIIIKTHPADWWWHSTHTHKNRTVLRAQENIP